MNIVFGDLLTLFASSYIDLATNWSWLLRGSVSDFHAKDPSANYGLIIQFTFIIIENKLNL